MEKFFLYKVYRYNKKLFFFFLIFAGLTLFCNFAGFEITPFYVWGMYSQKEVPVKEYPVFRITANGKIIDYSADYFPANRFFLLSPLSYYASIKDGDDRVKIFLKKKLQNKYGQLEPYAKRVLNSKKEIEEFPNWLRRYVQQSTGEKVNDLKVELLFVSYENNNSITINSIHTLIDEK